MVFTILTSLPTASITQLKQLCCIPMIISSMPLDHRSFHVFECLICLPLSTPLTIRVSSSLLSIFLPVVFLKGLFSVLYFLSCIPPNSALSPAHFLQNNTFADDTQLFSYSILVTLTRVLSTFKPLCSPGCLQIFLLLTQKTEFLIIGLRKQLPIDNS